MAKLYINKKIDSLGRIVIPKDIRNKLHIINNENLDITVEDDKIIIQKESEDAYNKRIFNIIIDVLKKEYMLKINIFNINKVYADSYGVKLSEKEMKDFIKNKKTKFDNFILYPIYPNGILYGGIILVKDNDTNVSSEVVSCFRNFIEKYLEE